MQMNVHNIVHWPEMLSKWGPAWSYSNFNPESMNGWIRKKCYGTGKMVAKAATRFVQAKMLSRDVLKLKDQKLKACCLEQLNLP